MVRLNDLISIHENVLTKNTCEDLIEFFETNNSIQETVNQNGIPNFTQINLTKNRSGKEKVHNLIVQKVFEYRDKYYKHVCKKVFPSSHAFEEIRIKRYNTDGEDRFDTHVDVMDYASSRRFLSFFWYLNDVEQGGETEFTDLIIKPKRGTLVIFPPLWMFPHKGNPPISNSKYLLSTYLHYK